MRGVIARIAERLAVHRCPVCGAVTYRRATLCDECLEKYTAERETLCRFCKTTAPGCVCSTRELYFCRELDLTMRSLLFYAPENPTLKALIKSLKYAPDGEAETFFARELTREILTLFARHGEAPCEWRVTFPPRSPSGVLKHGKDHARRMARTLASYTGMTFSPAFRHRGGSEQKTLGAAARLRNAKESFIIRDDADVRGAKYVIVDDVVTSGATMRACQTLLLSNGAKCAFVLSVAKTPMRGAGADMKRRYMKRKVRREVAKNN